MGIAPLFFCAHVLVRLIVCTAINDIYVPGLQRDVGMIAQTHRELCSDIEKYGWELSGDCRIKRVRVCVQERDSVVGNCAQIKGPHRSEYKNKNEKCIG